jgi:1-aminocyclopropane-1-carboxylate deaminase/D-cysteine desulfhydrase-like pyridoxal-dependent ACC family enzyme
MFRLGNYPTPLERLDGSALWVKRDDRVAELYGGNKVRKLEHLLGAAHAAGKRRLVTIGAAGSHQVVATALYGKREGFDVEAVLVSQPASDYAKDNLRVALAEGLVAVPASSWAAAPAVLARRLGRDAYLIPLGGSNAIGSIGFVDAARELASQNVEPDVVVVATGSGGTAAGLAVGFELAGMKTRVVGVAISPPLALVSALTRRLAKSTAKLAGLSRERSARAVERITIDRRWLGRGYGYPTVDGDEATSVAARAGIVLDATYTAKAFACALSLARREDVLYWHTVSATRPVVPDGALPPNLAALFR